jgi:hypothetical protein
VSKRAIDAVFRGLFNLTEIRVTLRETAPLHDLDETQRRQVADLLIGLEDTIRVIREELLE